jgi:hypothetical protein
VIPVADGVEALAMSRRTPMQAAVLDVPDVDELGPDMNSAHASPSA